MKWPLIAAALLLLTYVFLSAQSTPQPPAQFTATMDWSDPTHVDGAVCGMTAGTTTLLPLCKGTTPCEQPDGSFVALPGQQIQFGIWSVTANKCQIVSSTVLGRVLLSKAD